MISYIVIQNLKHLIYLKKLTILAALFTNKKLKKNDGQASIRRLIHDVKMINN